MLKRIFHLAAAALVLVACGTAPVAIEPLPEPTPLAIPTLGPPHVTPQPNLKGRLWVDQALGTIWIVDLPTGRVSKATTAPDVFPIQPSVPISGTPLAYAGAEQRGEGTTGRFGIYIELQLALPVSGDISYEDPAWSGDGAALYFTRIGVGPNETLTGTSGLTIQRLEIGDWRLATQQISSLQSPISIINDGFQPAPSFDGQWLAYTRVDVSDPLSPTRSIRARNLNTNEDRLLVPPSQFFDVYGPRWMPNDAQVVFGAAEKSTSGIANETIAASPLLRAIDALLGMREANAHAWVGDVWRVNADGSGLTRLTRQQFLAPIPAPSPDGEHIAVLSNDGLWIVNADGSGLTKISEQGGNGGLVWSR